MSKKTLIQFLNKERILTKFKRNLKRKSPVSDEFEHIRLSMPPVNQITYKDFEKIPYHLTNDVISFAFDWKHTPEGHIYWDSIDTKFRAWLTYGERLL